VLWGSGAVDGRIETQLDRIAVELGVREPQTVTKASDDKGQEASQDA